jgi:hypothetical protein
MENNKQQNDWQKRDIGALWKREGKNQKYLSGYVKVEGSDEEVKVVFSLLQYCFSFFNCK